jgi:hypothetical protein
MIEMTYQAANGAGATDPVTILLQYRGLAFLAGGDRNLSEHITIPSMCVLYFRVSIVILCIPAPFPFPHRLQIYTLSVLYLDILKEYNPRVFGASHGIGAADVWEVAQVRRKNNCVKRQYINERNGLFIDTNFS